MPSYELELNFEPDVLETVQKAGQQIKIAKPVNGESPNVIWLSVDPFQSNVITWEEQYGIYVSDTKIQHGAHITKISETNFPASDHAYYRLTNANVFKGPFTDRDVRAGTFAAYNEVDYDKYQSLTFGLTQTALVNAKPHERKPLSATPVLSRQAVEMTPFTHIYIWLQAEFASETIISRIIGMPTMAKFGGDVQRLSLKYRPQLGTFQPE